MSTQPKPRLTPEEYLAIERAAEFKSEYYAGEMFAMSGASSAHNFVSGNLYSAIRKRRPGSECRTYIADMRVLVPATGLYTYPDVAVVCGEQQFADSSVDTLLNPTLIGEVLSPSTENYDRGRKFEQYRRIPSLNQYVLLAQDRFHVEVYTRKDDGWLLTTSQTLTDIVELTSIRCSIPLAELYVDVDFTRTQI